MLVDWHVNNYKDPHLIDILFQIDTGYTEIFPVDVLTKILRPNLVTCFEGEIYVSRYIENVPVGVVRPQECIVRQCVFV